MLKEDSKSPKREAWGPRARRELEVSMRVPAEEPWGGVWKGREHEDMSLQRGDVCFAGGEMPA